MASQRAGLSIFSSLPTKIFSNSCINNPAKLWLEALQGHISRNGQRLIKSKQSLDFCPKQNQAPHKLVSVFHCFVSVLVFSFFCLWVSGGGLGFLFVCLFDLLFLLLPCLPKI